MKNTFFLEFLTFLNFIIQFFSNKNDVMFYYHHKKITKKLKKIFSIF